MPVATMVTLGWSSHAGGGGGDPSKTKTTSVGTFAESRIDSTRRPHRSKVPDQKTVGMMTEISIPGADEAVCVMWPSTPSRPTSACRAAGRTDRVCLVVIAFMGKSELGVWGGALAMKVLSGEGGQETFLAESKSVVRSTATAK